MAGQRRTISEGVTSGPLWYQAADSLPNLDAGAAPSLANVCAALMYRSADQALRPGGRESPFPRCKPAALQIRQEAI
jgi:hypothetical protein